MHAFQELCVLFTLSCVQYDADRRVGSACHHDDLGELHVYHRGGLLDLSTAGAASEQARGVLLYELPGKAYVRHTCLCSDLGSLIFCSPSGSR